MTVDSQRAVAYGLRTLATSSPVSPLPGSPVLFEIGPSQGVNTAVVQVNLYGNYLRPGGQVYLQYAKDQSDRAGTSERPLIPIRSTYVSSQHIVAKIPARVSGKPLTPGFYDIGIIYQDAKPVLHKAYRVLEPQTVDDLYAEAYHLTSIPSTLWVGEQSALTLKVHRLGGTNGTGPFNVDFYANTVDAGNLIGTAKITGISPNSSANSSLVSWIPEKRGAVEIIAVIDAGGDVAESDETNNIVKISRRVWQQLGEDTYAPLVTKFHLDTGEDEVHEREIALVSQLEDRPDPKNPHAFISGPSRIYYAELHWYAGIGNGTGSWIPVTWTHWLPYDKEPDEFVLHPTPGLRYLQAWGADAAGNISVLPALFDLTYIPDSDEVEAGEIRVYRRKVAGGACLDVRITPAAPSMDPDLYVWGPTGDLAGFSLEGAGMVDRVTVQPADAGVYQIEVEGFTAADYSIQIDVSEHCNGLRNTQPNAVTAKTPRTVPVLPVDEAPGAEDAPAPQEEIIQYLTFLLVTTADQRNNQAPGIYLPMLTR
jgi:hypothetical protein